MAPQGKAAARASSKGLRKTPGVEVEIKLRVTDRKAILRRLRQLKAVGGARLHEMNTLYDTTEGALARDGKLIRIRSQRPAPAVRAGKRGGGAGRRPSSAAGAAEVLLTYKGPAQGEAEGSRYKTREEQELHVEDAETLARVFEGMGLRPRFRYEKYRTTYRLPGLAKVVVELDETPIGEFLELEGSPAQIDRAAAMLGFHQDEYIVKSYGALFVEQRHSAAQGAASPGESTSSDMLFARRR